MPPGATRGPQDAQEEGRRGSRTSPQSPGARRSPERMGQGHPKPGQIRGQRPPGSRTDPAAAGLSGWNEESGPRVSIAPSGPGAPARSPLPDSFMTENAPIPEAILAAGEVAAARWPKPCRNPWWKLRPRRTFGLSLE